MPTDTDPYVPSSPIVTDGDKLVSFAVDAWKTTVSVQQHFNDLELRVRNFAITFITAVLGLVGLALKDDPRSLLPWALLAIGIIGWLAFYVMDRWWYHRFLEGAGQHAGNVEKWLVAATGTGTHLFHLSETIKDKSAVRIMNREVHSRHRIDLFYCAVVAAALVLAIVLYHARPSKELRPTEVVLKTDPGGLALSLPPGVGVCSAPVPTPQTAPPPLAPAPQRGKPKR